MRKSGPGLPVCSAALAALSLLAGCHSPWVRATVTNNENTPIKLVEVEYPGGTFGVQSIAAHASYHYRFRILDNDKVKMDFVDAAGHSHKATGPEMQQGQEGTLGIDIAASGAVSWNSKLTAHR